MKKHRIAVTATGGGVGQSILKALKDSDYEVIALDGDRLGAGLYMVSESYLIPYARDPEFIPFLLNLCKGKDIDLLFPGMDCELPKLSEAKKMFNKLGVKIPISNTKIIDIADNKLTTQHFLKNNKFPYIKTFIYGNKMRYVLKPRTGGARSQNMSFVTDKDIFTFKNNSNYVAQEYIEGDEYTCGMLTLDGKYIGCIVMRRILRDGDTYKAFVERNETIENLCRDICNILKPEGAFNIQLRMRDGVPYVFEFNARCSGTTAARALAGFNEPKMIADYYLKNIEPEFKIKEINILRYWNELIVEKLI